MMSNIVKIEANKSLSAMSEQDVLDYDLMTGDFHWKVNRRGGAKIGDKAGTVKRGGYIQINVLGRLQYAHRLAWLFVYGSLPNFHVDHIDGNPSNNAISNLRDVSVKTNMQNQRKAQKSNRSSGLLGVSFDAINNKWLAKISIDNRTKNIGRYDTPQIAHEAYIEAKRNLHEGNTL